MVKMEHNELLFSRYLKHYWDSFAYSTPAVNLCKLYQNLGFKKIRVLKFPVLFFQMF